jgi:deoxynucleotidyltransferase terminal-interacting protein 1
MGFGPTRGRLYMKHQEIFRYSGDSEDKEWLVRHSLMPPTGQKAFVMIVDDIIELTNTPEYRFKIQNEIGI